jgi:hypothetical protein
MLNFHFDGKKKIQKQNSEIKKKINIKSFFPLILSLKTSSSSPFRTIG